MTDGEPTAALAGWRKIEQAATPGPWQSVTGEWEAGETFPAVISRDGDPAKAETWLMAAGRGSADPESNATFTAMARTAVPCLLAAVEAALKLAEPDGEVHRDLDGNEERGVVRVVRCDVLREAITAALTGKEAGDGA